VVKEYAHGGHFRDWRCGRRLGKQVLPETLFGHGAMTHRRERYGDRRRIILVSTRMTPFMKRIDPRVGDTGRAGGVANFAMKISWMNVIQRGTRACTTGQTGSVYSALETCVRKGMGGKETGRRGLVKCRGRAWWKRRGTGGQGIQQGMTHVKPALRMTDGGCRRDEARWAFVGCSLQGGLPP